MKIDYDQLFVVIELPDFDSMELLEDIHSDSYGVEWNYLTIDETHILVERKWEQTVKNFVKNIQMNQQDDS